MRAIIKNNNWIYFDNITPNEDETLFVEFSVSSPNDYIDSSQFGAWDGVFRKYNKAKKRIARPLLSMLKGICAKYDFPLEIIDARPAPTHKPIDPSLIDEHFLPGITLDPHQLDSIKKAADNVECGIFWIPTSGGKTEIIAGICKAINCLTVIIADQTVVIDQLKARLELRDVDDDIGLFYAGSRPNGGERIVVGSIQSLQPSKAPEPVSREEGETDESYDKKLKNWEIKNKAYHTRQKNSQYLREYVKKADMLIVDEADLAVNDYYKRLFRNWYKGRRRYGFSGTPFDDEKPVENLIVQEHFGSPVVKVTRKYLESINRIIPCEYVMLAIGPYFDMDESSALDIAVREHLVENVNLHKIVAGLFKRHKGDGNLILVENIEFGNSLCEILNNRGLVSRFIYGKTSKKARDEALRAFEKRQFDVLLGGKIINRGLDLAGGCENMLIATGGKLASGFDQKIGRALRHNKNGKSTIYDFFFRGNKHLYKHSKARLKTIVKMGYKSKVIFPKGVLSGEDVIKRNFNIHKKYFI